MDVPSRGEKLVSETRCSALTRSLQLERSRTVLLITAEYVQRNNQRVARRVHAVAIRLTPRSLGVEPVGAGWCITCKHSVRRWTSHPHL